MLIITRAKYRTIVEQALNDAMYNLTNWRSRGVTHVIVTAETITEGRPPMLYPEPVEQVRHLPRSPSHATVFHDLP